MSRPSRTLLLLLALSTPAAAFAAAAGSHDGFVDERWLVGRQRDYLEFATASPLAPGSVNQAIAYMERERVDAGFSTTPGAVGAGAYDAIFDKLAALRDTSDFDVLRLLDLVYGYEGHAMLAPELWAKIEAALLGFKYWYVDPSPPDPATGEPRIDNMWYWTENHTLIFRSCELLAGKRHPSAVFAVSGETGAWHAARARAAILEWLDERARWGFNEWHSNVYYSLDMTPLLALVEWSDDPEIELRASMLLDLLFLDLALHLHRGSFGATHGRSYAKDKASATSENTYGASLLLFEDSLLPYASRGDGVATPLAHTRKYRLPEVIRRIARHDGAMIDRERMNLPVDEKAPADLAIQIPPGPAGLDFRDEGKLPLWWSMGLFTTWLGLPLTIEVAEREGLWLTDAFAPFYPLIEPSLGAGDPDAVADALRPYTSLLWPVLSLAVLKQVNTYTYRTADYMLSTVQDYRKGLRGSQIHSWQATLGERAIVFTNHPGYRALPLEQSQIPADWDWQKEDEPGPGYWTGEASIPRSAQHENVAIHIYAAQYRGPLFESLVGMGFVNETHAYFPHAHFDEVVQEAGWTFGRYRSGYVALYSHVATSWRSGQPELFENAGLPFDLVAEGSKDNVFVVECGSESDWGSFAAFRAAITAAEIVITPTANVGSNLVSQGFDVRYLSPSQGTLEFDWSGPLLVNGTPVSISDYPRFSNPFIESAFDSRHYAVSDAEFGATLDFVAGTREVFALPEPAAELLSLAALAILAALRGRARDPRVPLRHRAERGAWLLATSQRGRCGRTRCSKSCSIARARTGSMPASRGEK